MIWSRYEELKFTNVKLEGWACKTKEDGFTNKMTSSLVTMQYCKKPFNEDILMSLIDRGKGTNHRSPTFYKLSSVYQSTQKDGCKNNL